MYKNQGQYVPLLQISPNQNAETRQTNATGMFKDLACWLHEAV